MGKLLNIYLYISLLYIYLIAILIKIKYRDIEREIKRREEGIKDKK
jgi:uncharacterized membrane protein YhdT